MQRLVLVDGLGLLFRSFYAMPNMVNMGQQNIGGVYGFARQIHNIIQNKQPDHLIVAFDTGFKTWRHAVSHNYKANRKPSPIELRHQFQLARDACKTMNIQYVELQGYEADDICASYVAKYKNKYEIYIASIDKDLMQLVQQNVYMYDPFKKHDIDENTVLQKMNVRPNQIVDFLSMVGDASDGIAGITGIGIKTAAKWLNEYNCINGILNNLSALIPNRLAKTLQNEYQQLQLAKRLITLTHDLDVPDVHALDLHLNINCVANQINQFFSNIGIQNKNLYLY